MTKRRILIAIGATALAALVVAALVAAAPLVARGPITVTAHFKDAVGLYRGNAVSVLGMPVGKVTKVETKAKYVEVTIQIDRDTAIPADVTAVTVSASLLTDRHIELTPPYEGGAKLRDGDLVGLGNTRTPVEFDKTLSVIDKLGTALRGDPKGGGPLGDLVNLGARITTANGTEIKSTLDELSQALKVGPDGGTRTQKNIQQIVTNLADLTASAAGKDAAIRQFGSNVRQLSDLLADQNLGSGDTGAKANEILQRMADLLDRHRDQLRGTFSDARTITTTLADNRRELEEILDVAPLTVDNIYNMIDPNAGSIRVHLMTDKMLFNSQMSKEICNLMGLKQLGCATGTLKDYGPDFGLNSMLDLMANGIQQAPR
ncbi:mammalian cell entry protein [Mycobacterium sp. CBMA 234]|uniref:MCE family protein n=1 Tax=Mycolicibacterium sp. CBMA 234 TaxID=1918495 RepID=UPI0012DF4526|nr:MCE family protein [Mycolicibacterium sp. CBMA 234]MUL67457.1 mammalian cell entry protein [Mycolicibacterium sp. CBMA 234]